MYGSGKNPEKRQYTSTTKAHTSTFEHPSGQPNPYTSNRSNQTSNNLPQNYQDVFPDLPPSYEVAMTDEPDMCW